MQIVISIKSKRNTMDIQVNNEMSILNVIKILKENRNLQDMDDIEYVYSKQKQESIGVHFTFKEARIFSGDCLILRGQENG